MWMKDTTANADPLPESLKAYRESVEEFSKHVAELLKQVPTLTKARDAYQRAMMISTELRNILDTGDEALKELLAQLEQAVGMSPLKLSPAEKKKPESAKVEPLKKTPDESEVVRVLP
jgi:exonuclease VII small subunit